jgi:hypothetical protein
MKAFGWFFLFAVMASATGLTWAGDGFSLACDRALHASTS